MDLEEKVELLEDQIKVLKKIIAEHISDSEAHKF